MEPSAEEQLKATMQVIPAVNQPLPPLKRKSSTFRLILVVSTILVISISTIIAGISIYTNINIPFFPQNVKKTLLLSLYSIPFIPKTSEQILLVAVESNTKLTSYNPEFSFSAALGTSAISAGSIDLKIKGPVDFSHGKKASFDLDIDFGSVFAGTSYKGSGHISKVEDIVYGKINTISDSIIEAITSFPLLSTIDTDDDNESGDISQIRQNLNNVFKYWISYDTKSIESEAKKALESRSQEQSIIDSTRIKTQELLLRKDILPEVKRLPDEKIDEVSTYHLQLSPSKDNLQNILLELYPEAQRSDDDVQKAIDNITNSIESVRIDVWFGKMDTILRKISIQTQINLNTLTNLFYGSLSTLPGDPLSTLNIPATPKLTMSTILSIKDIGSVVNIQTPSPVKTLSEYTQMLTEATITEKQKQQKAKLKRFNNDFNLILEALSKHYVEVGTYPGLLNDLVGNYIAPNNELVNRLNTYSFRRSSDGRKFIVYIEYQYLTSSGYTPYYGFTSESSYPHQLSKRDFDEIQ